MFFQHQMIKMDGPSPRIIRQIKRILSDPLEGVTIEEDLDNYRHFFIELQGEKNTCYEEGRFKLELLLPEDYPMCPPKVVFNTKIYHPNISKLGKIDLGILGRNWSPALQIRSVLISIRSLMRHPDPYSPYEQEIGQHWKSNIKSAKEKAREWALEYAQ